MPARLRLPLRLPDPPADDRALVGRFADARDGEAFAALVRRHGRMVLGVCRRAVGDAHLAEDAFQAVFLVLARNPLAAGRAASVGGWLFGVARRVGLAARRRAARGQRAESRGRTEAARVFPPPPDLCLLTAELCEVLDDEVARLPDDCRAAVVACFLREQTQDEAARQLGWSLSTLRRRLDRGKELLRGRLARRGAALGAGLLAGSVGPAAGAAVPVRLADATARLAESDSPPSLVAALAAAGAGHAAGPKLLAAAAVLVAGGLAAGFAAPDVPPPPPSEAAADAPAPPRATLAGRVVFPADRPVPVPRPLPRGTGWVKDEAVVFAAGPRVYEDLLVDPTTRGVANAVIALRPVGQPFAFDPPPREHLVEATGCRFVPRVVLARPGDTVRFANADPVPHNVRLGPAFNVLLPAGNGRAAGPPLVASRTPDRFRCDIHPWMEGWVWAADTPYAAVTAADGSFTLPGVPPGPYRLTVWHERTGLLPARRVEVGLATDLGPIVIGLP